MSQLFFQNDYYSIYTVLKDFEQLIAEQRLLDAHIISALYMARSFLAAHT